MTEDPLTEEEMAKIGTLERGNRLVKGQVFLWEGAKDWHDLWDMKNLRGESAYSCEGRSPLTLQSQSAADMQSAELRPIF